MTRDLAAVVEVVASGMAVSRYEGTGPLDLVVSRSDLRFATSDCLERRILSDC